MEGSTGPAAWKWRRRTSALCGHSASTISDIVDPQALQRSTLHERHTSCRSLESISS